jgi:hypothetical protein
MGCLTEAQQHFERIKHFYDTGGPYGFLAASYYYRKMSECRIQIHGSDGDNLHDLYVEASKLMEVMKSRAAGDLKP